MAESREGTTAVYEIDAPTYDEAWDIAAEVVPFYPEKFEVVPL